MTGPGKPLGPINLRWVKVPGRDTYYNLDTGQTTNRTGYRNIIAQKYGFVNASDYDRFSSQMNGLGGLTGYKVKDIQRVHNLVRKYEREHRLPRYSLGSSGGPPIGFTYLVPRAQDWLNEPPGTRRNEFLIRMLDAFGVPRPKYRWAPGDSP